MAWHFLSFHMGSHWWVRQKGDLPMKRSLYGERDYAFGQPMLTLRTHIGLTQASLAQRLGISRRPVSTWELGSNYPARAPLRELIALRVRASAFPPVHAEAEVP